MSRFEEFWEAWPSPKDPKYRSYKRKTDKKKCRELWEARHYDNHAPLILMDVQQRAKYDKGWLQQEGEFLSAPLVYLRNERWDGSEWSDVRDEKKAKQKTAQGPQTYDSGPFMSRYARFANLALLQKLLRIKGSGSTPEQASEALLTAVKKKNEIVAMAEQEAWENEDFRSVILATIDGAFEETKAHSPV